MIRRLAYQPIGGCDFAQTKATTEPLPLAFWRAAVDPMVLAAEARRTTPKDGEALDIFKLTMAVAVLRADEGIEHVLIGDGRRRLRLELCGDSLIDGPVRLHYGFDGFFGLDARIWTLRRLLALWRSGRLPRTLFPPDRRLRRWVMALQAYDGRSAGASQREIARAILGERLFAGEVHFEALRKQIARLIQLAEQRIEAARYRFLGP